MKRSLLCVAAMALAFSAAMVRADPAPAPPANAADSDPLGDLITAALTGQGFAVTPEGPQSAPLLAGQPIVFRWSVTPQAGAHGPLQAEINADLLTDGRTLPLGTIKSLAGVGRATGRVVGVGLLVLIALALLGWAARRRRPTPAGATRPRNNHMSGL